MRDLFRPPSDAVAAERERSETGGEERHVAVVFIDIVGSNAVIPRSRRVIQALNKFFAIVVDEVTATTDCSASSGTRR